MLQLSSHSHSLLRLYRFRDPRMEERYQADMNMWSVYNTQLGYFTAAILQVVGCVSYVGTSPLPLGFWVTFGSAVICSAFFLNGLFNERSRRYTIFINFLFSIITISTLVAMMFVYPELWTGDKMIENIPEGGHMYTGSDCSNLEVFDGQFQYFLVHTYIQYYWLTVFAIIQIPMMHFCLTGLNVWSLLGYGYVLISSSVMLCLSALSTWSLSYPATFFNILNLTSLVMTYVVLAILLERIQRRKFLAETLLEQQMRASETADSILNHTLKNILADVAAYIDLFLTGGASQEVLVDALACLRRGVKACKERQVYLKLVMGSYAAVANPVDLEAFTEDLVAGRQVRTSVISGTAYFDQTLLTLILDNALTNAVKHGHPENPDVAFTVRALPEDPSDTEADAIEFAVSNFSDPARPPLAPEAVAALLSGAPRPQKLGRAPLLSDGIGLGHAKMAADVAGIRISLVQEGLRVVFRAVIDCSDPSSPRGVGPPARRYMVDSLDLPEPSPDDPAFQPAVPESPPPDIPAQAQRHSDRSVVAASALLRPSEAPGISVLPLHIKVFVLDDTASSRRILEQQLRHAFPTVQQTLMGAEENDVALFTAMAADEAAIVILDQHLEYSGGSYLGTTVAQRLQVLGYSGMICIRSADDSPEDQALYTASGAHLFLSKGLPGTEMVRRLATAYREFTESFGRTDRSSLHQLP